MRSTVVSFFSRSYDSISYYTILLLRDRSIGVCDLDSRYPVTEVRIKTGVKMVSVEYFRERDLCM